MTCICSLAGTAACASCLNNPNSAKQYSNFITWTNSAERTCHRVDVDGYSFRFECSLCGYVAIVHNCAVRLDELPKYCPNCGAKVVGE